MGELFIVAGPIGNLEDITLRAINVLKSVDIIYCEDTRITKRLLEKYNISGKILRSANARTEQLKADSVVGDLQKGYKIAYLSDAGTPGLSDPGALIVARARQAGARVIPIPGPSAFLAALSASGVPAHKFTFYGFLPNKKGRQSALKEILNFKHPVVLYESKHRIIKLLQELSSINHEKQIILAREISKIHEEFLYGTAQELLDILNKNKEKQKGEFVVILY